MPATYFLFNFLQAEKKPFKTIELLKRTVGITILTVC